MYEYEMAQLRASELREEARRWRLGRDTAAAERTRRATARKERGAPRQDGRSPFARAA